MPSVRELVWNQGRAVAIHPELDVRVREMKVKLVWQHIFFFQRIAQRFQQRHPDVQEWTAATTMQFVAEDLDIFVEEVNTGLHAVIRDATDIPAEDVDAVQEWPLSVFFNLVSEILEAQRPAIEGFFNLRGRARSMVAPRAEVSPNGAPLTKQPQLSPSL